MFLGNPKSVIGKDFRTDVSAFANLAIDQRYIFPDTALPHNISEQKVTRPRRRAAQIRLVLLSLVTAAAARSGRRIRQDPGPADLPHRQLLFLSPRHAQARRYA